MFNNILFVCVGNVCRSPMAEGLFKKNLDGIVTNIQITSAGINALVNNSAAKEAQELMLANSIDISAHKARQLTPQMLLSADLILVMEKAQQRHIENITPEIRGRIFLLGHWGGYEIPDPYHKSKEFFMNSFKLIERSWKEWQYRLCA